MPKLTNLDVQFVSLVDRAAVRNPTDPTQPQRFLLWKSERGTNHPGGTMTPEETAAALAKAESERDALTKTNDELTAKVTKLEETVAELQKAAKPPEPTKIDKSALDPAVRELLEKAEAAEQTAKAERDELRKAAERAEEIAKEERDRRVTREFVQKAESYASLALDAEKFGPVLKSVSEKLTKDEADELERVLKAADAQLETSNLYKELGRGGEAPAGPSDAEQELTRKAEEIRKADPSVSRMTAMRQAMAQDPDAAARYLSQSR